MKIFRTKSEMAEMKDLQELKRTIQTLDHMVEEIRHTIGYRRTLLKNAEKKLQEFQDTLYAMIMEEDSSKKKTHNMQDNDEKPTMF